MTDRIMRFHYEVRDWEGKLIKGVMYANSEEECVEQLRINRMFLIRLKRVSRSKEGWFSHSKKIQYGEIATFCNQFSALLKAGIAIPQALKLMSFQKAASKMQGILSETLQSLQKGESLNQGFLRYQEKFPPFFCSLIRAGEMTNSLDQVFERLAVFYDQEDQFRKQLSQLMVYPLILTFSTMSVVAFLFLKIIPGFVEIYEGFEAQLPLLTYCLMSISRHLTVHFKQYFFGFPLCMFSLSYVLKIPKVKNKIFSWQYKLPVWGKMKKKLLTARLARTWSLLLANGLEVLPAIELTIGTIDRLTDQYLRQIAIHVQQGSTFVRSLRSINFFPDLFLEMVQIGEESGALSVMLARSAEMFEKEGRDQIQRFLTLLEPTLLLTIALIVGLIVLAVMLPMFDLIKVF